MDEYHNTKYFMTSMLYLNSNKNTFTIIYPLTLEFYAITNFSILHLNNNTGCRNPRPHVKTLDFNRLTRIAICRRLLVDMKTRYFDKIILNIETVFTAFITLSNVTNIQSMKNKYLTLTIITNVGVIK